MINIEVQNIDNICADTNPFKGIGKPFAVIADFPEYAVTPDGEVWSYKFAGVPQARLQKLSPSPRSNGYYYVELREPGRRKSVAIHALVLTYFGPPKFEGAVVHHIDANRGNNNIENLMWATVRENTRYGYESSGIGPERNIRTYYLEYPDGTFSEHIQTRKGVVEYIQEKNLDLNINMLCKWKPYKGFKLHRVH